MLKWKGYPEEENTWEPSCNLFCTSILREYKQKHNLLPKSSPPSLEDAHGTLSKSNCVNHKMSSNYRGERGDTTPVDSMNGVLSGHQASKWKKQKKRKRASSKRDRWYVAETSEKFDKLKMRKEKELKLVVSIPLDTRVRAHQYCHNGLSHDNREVLGSAHDIIDITGSSDDSLEVLPGDDELTRPASVYSTVSGMNGFHKRFDTPGRGCNSVQQLKGRHKHMSTQSSSCDHAIPQLVSIEHKLACLKHDHPYFKLCSSKGLPSILTPPPSAEPCDEPSFCPQSTDVSDVTISPPPTPTPLTCHPRSEIDRYFAPYSPQLAMTDEYPRSNSPIFEPYSPKLATNEYPQSNSPVFAPYSPKLTTNDYPRSNSPIPLSPLSTALKLQWSSASSVSDDDFEVCSGDNVSPRLTTKPRQETRVPSKNLRLAFTYGEKKPYKPSHISLNSGWRKGPVPLPRSFSKRHSSITSFLQTKAAKHRGVPKNAGHVEPQRIKTKKFSLSLKRRPENGLEPGKKKVKPSEPEPVIITNDENHFDQAFPPEDSDSLECRAKSGRESADYASRCTYKELLMDWQYELNKQRDGTDDIICVENDMDMVPPPTEFNYICSNLYTDGVPNPSSPDLTSSLCGCECYYLGRKCGPKSEYCCANMAGSKFAYTPAGKVKVQPGTPIYECNAKCSCPSDCSNRIVQLGRKIPLCIFRTVGRGWGVKTIEPIKPNTFVTEYVGEVITNEEAERRGKKCDAEGITYLFDLDFEDDNSAFTIDAAKYGNISHFFNHSVSAWMWDQVIACFDSQMWPRRPYMERDKPLVDIIQ